MGDQRVWATRGWITLYWGSCRCDAACCTLPRLLEVDTGWAELRHAFDCRCTTYVWSIRHGVLLLRQRNLACRRGPALVMSIAYFVHVTESCRHVGTSPSTPCKQEMPNRDARRGYSPGASISIMECIYLSHIINVLLDVEPCLLLSKPPGEGAHVTWIISTLDLTADNSTRERMPTRQSTQRRRRSTLSSAIAASCNNAIHGRRRAAAEEVDCEETRKYVRRCSPRAPFAKSDPPNALPCTGLMPMPMSSRTTSWRCCDTMATREPFGLCARQRFPIS